YLSYTLSVSEISVTSEITVAHTWKMASPRRRPGQSFESEITVLTLSPTRSVPAFAVHQRRMIFFAPFASASASSASVAGIGQTRSRPLTRLGFRVPGLEGGGVASPPSSLPSSLTE